MPEVTLQISERERREIENIGRIEGDKIGRIDPVTVEEMAGALLQSHLVLIRDCGDILPGTGPKLKPLKVAGKIKGKGGVSLSGGVNGSV